MSASPTIGVLAIQGDVREHSSRLTDSGATVRLVKYSEDFVGIQGLVIPGGESTTMSILAEKNGLLEPLRGLKNQIPMYGSCAGLIMLADMVSDGRMNQQTIGGLHITAQRNAFGRQKDSFELDLKIEKLGEPAFHAIFIRAPLVTQVGADVEVLASITEDVKVSDTDAGHIPTTRIVAIQQGNLLATSFHPELTSDLRVHQYFVEMVRSA